MTRKARLSPLKHAQDRFKHSYTVMPACRSITIVDPEIQTVRYLPNNLTVANIRNPILASYATKILPYRGLGSGIRRALKAYPDIEFVDDREGNQFKMVIKRAGGATDECNEEKTEMALMALKKRLLQYTVV